MEGTQTWTHAGLRVHGSSSGDGTGGSMAGGWDLVGDGYADVAIGVDAWDGRATGGGAVMLFAGPGDDGDVDLDAATVMIEAYEADLGAGFSLAMLGDHDGGGEPWIAVGCHSTASSSAGRIYLLEGPFIESSIDLQANAEVSLEFAEPGDNVGQAVAGGLDATGNGYTDLVVSATGAADGDGEVLVFEGPVSAFATRETALGVIAGASDDDMLGLDVDLVPDVDGDGLADLLIGAATAGSGFHGEVQLFLSPLAEGISQDDASERYQGESENALMYRADAAGDVDGDGRGDMILGAPFQGKEAEGKAYLLLGATNPVSTLAGAEATFVGSVAGAILGNAVVGLEDFDADGYGDLLLGAPGVDAPDADSGACYLFHGPLQGALESASADATLQGPGVGASAGVYMSSAGDIDGDGRSDALIGAPGGELGQVALLHGEGW
jgi:hypothetical protein